MRPVQPGARSPPPHRTAACRRGSFRDCRPETPPGRGTAREPSARDGRLHGVGSADPVAVPSPLVLAAVAVLAIPVAATAGGDWRDHVAPAGGGPGEPVRTIGSRGAVERLPALLEPGGQAARVAAGPDGDAYVELDFGREVVGVLEVVYARASADAPLVRISYSETQAALGRFSDFSRTAETDDHFPGPTARRGAPSAAVRPPRSAPTACAASASRGSRPWGGRLGRDRRRSGPGGAAARGAGRLPRLAPDERRALNRAWYASARTLELVTGRFSGGERRPRLRPSGPARPRRDPGRSQARSLPLCDRPGRLREDRVPDARAACSGGGDPRRARRRAGRGRLHPAEPGRAGHAAALRRPVVVGGGGPRLRAAHRATSASSAASGPRSAACWTSGTRSSHGRTGSSTARTEPRTTRTSRAAAASSRTTTPSTSWRSPPAADLAAELGEPEQARAWTRRANQVAAAMRRLLWDAEAGAFRDTTEDFPVHPLDGNALAVVAGVATAPQANSRWPTSAAAACARGGSRSWTRSSGRGARGDGARRAVSTRSSATSTSWPGSTADATARPWRSCAGHGAGCSTPPATAAARRGRRSAAQATS